MNLKLTCFAYAFLLCILTPLFLQAQNNQIILSPEQIQIVFPVESVKNYEALVDEQEKYPQEGQFRITLEDGTTDTLESVPYSEWVTGWQPGTHEAIIDLGDTYSLDQISLYRFYSDISVNVYSGEPGAWNLEITDDLNGLYNWNNHLCSATTRYLRFTANVNKTFPAVEIVVFGDLATADTIPPSVIDDLNVSNITSGQVWLNWTSPSDNDETGKAQAYDLRYSTTPISTETWIDAISVPLAVPSDAGITDSTVVTDLSAGVTYYWGITSTDNAGNESGLSNILVVKTDDIDTIPPGKVTDLSIESIDSTTISIAFTPLGDDGQYDNYNHVVIKYYTDSITESNWGIIANEVTLPYSENLSGYVIDQLYEGERYFIALKVVDEAGNASVLSNSVVARTLYKPQKMRLLPEMFSLSKEPHRTATASIAALADEQTFVGDPLYGEWQEPLTDFVPAWQDQDTYYPVEGYIDLGSPRDISMIYLFDQSNADTLEVYYGTTSGNDTTISWHLLFIDELKKYNTWSVHDNLNITAQYLKLNFTAIGAHLSEILLYGYVPEDTVPPVAVSDLALDKLTSVTADISWTAPGDDGIYDIAESYQLGLSNSMITEENWANVTLIEDINTPDLPESAENYKFEGLNPATEYYVALRTMDDNNNLSDISNVISFTTEVEDIIAPSTIINLSVADVAPDAVRIDWTSGGDDGNIGIADRYEIRYNTSPVTEENWSNSMQTISIIAPDSAGNNQFLSIYGLNEETTYYLGLKVYDEVNNSSSLSNMVSFTTTKKVPYQQPYVDDYIGCNALINAWLTHMQAFGYIREYHNWYWTDPGADISGSDMDSTYTGYPNNKLRFNFWNGYWNFDNYYKKLHASGVMVAPCLQQSVPWLPDYSDNNYFRPTLTLQDDTELPESYIAHSDFMFQYAARYGNTEVADEYLKVDEGQGRLSGLGHIRYYENWNEPNKWWHGAYAQFSAEQMAAMCSGDYDGDLGRMGNTVGVRNADINSKLVLGGLVGLDLQFIKDMKAWSDSARAGSFPCDVINLHHYCNVTHNGQKTMEKGSSPESDSLKYMVREIRDYIDANLPGKELWITEFGWDTDMSSDQRCEPIKGYSSEEVQAMWLVRAFLEMYAGGVDRAAIFTLYDADDPSSGRFASCGVISNEASGRVPKVGWYYTYALRNILAKTRFVTEHETDNENVLMYEFASDAKEKEVYAVWCPTSDSVTVPGYKISVKGKSTPVALVQLEHGNIEGVRSYPEIINDSITIEVSEVPQFIVFGNEPADVTPPATIDSISFSYADKSLKWLASGDDGDQKMADYYIIKVDTIPLTEERWGNILAYDTIDATVLPSYEESYLLDGLPEDVTYYMALKAYDEAGNASGISKQLIKMQQIVLDTTMLTIISGGGTGLGLVDEQFSEEPVTKWQGSYHDDKQVLVDLEKEYVVPFVYFYRQYEKESFDLYAGITKDTMELVGTFNGTVYGWNEIALSDTVRYLRFECNDDCYFPFMELKLIGTDVGQDSIIDVPVYNDTTAVDNLTETINSDATVDLSFSVPQTSNLSGFLVLRSNTLITEANWEQTETTEYNESLSVLETKQVTISGLETGVPYYFAVKLLNEEGSSSALSNVVMVQITDDIAPDAISDFSLNRTGNALDFSWTTGGDDGAIGLASSYDIWFSDQLITDVNLGSAELFAADIINDDYSGVQQFDAVYDKSSEGFFAITATDKAGNKSLVSNNVTSDMQIILKSEMVTVIEGGGANDAYAMVDEQFVAEPSTKWDGDYFSPKEIVIDLQDTYLIIKEIFYRMFSRDDIHVYSGEPNNWNYLYKDDYYKTLTNTYNDTVVTRYIRLVETKKRTYWPLYELKLYGSIYQPVIETRSISLEGAGAILDSEEADDGIEEKRESTQSLKVFTTGKRIVAESDTDTEIKMTVFNVTGNGIAIESGWSSVFSPTLNSGVYIVRITGDKFSENRKVLIK